MNSTPVQRERRQQQKGFVSQPGLQTAWKPYIWMLVCLGGVLATNTYLLQHMQSRLPLAGITLPIMLGALYGGLRPGLLATLLSLLAGFYISGIRWGDSIDLYQQLQIIMFLIVGVMISWFGEQQRNSHLKLAELALATAKRKDDFLAMLGHELRNPLSGICSSARMLVHPGIDKHGMTESANIIHRQAKHMEHLINDLLDVSRVTRGQVEIEKAPVDLVANIHAAAEQVSDLVEHREHQLVLNLPTSPVWVLGCRRRLNIDPPCRSNIDPGRVADF